jgi:phospholipid/cholesterol/gamma-HCH transport system ATP-binding protein
MTKQVVIDAKDLSVGYGDYVLLHDANYQVNKGDIFIIMGGSGCGKSSMLRVLTGLIPPLKGTVVIDGVDIAAAPDTEVQKIHRKSGILYQSGALFSSMTLAENIMLPLQQYSDYSPATMRELAHLKLALVGLSGFDDFIHPKSAAV